MAERGGTIDLNCDLGEGFGLWQMGDDEAILAVVTSANVACGFHAGDPRIMLRTVNWASALGVTIGAHVSYPDLVGFGRRPFGATAEEIVADVIYQIGALDGAARVCGGRVRYVKAHGALYHTMAIDPPTAEAVVEAVRRYDPSLLLLTLPNSAALIAAAAAGIAAVTEYFADRAYSPDGTLIPRRIEGAIISDKEEVVRRSIQMAAHNQVIAIDGSTIEIQASSLCLHSDTPGAVSLARSVRRGLEEAGIALQAFATDSVKTEFEP
jgi:UPF0271 protein